VFWVLMRRVLITVLVVTPIAGLAASSPARSAQPLAATVKITAPVTPGVLGEEDPSAFEESEPGALVADPVQGAWLSWYGPAGEQLVRIEEGGAVRPVAVPSKFLGKDVTGMKFTPLADGWGVAMIHYWPGGTSERQTCSEEGGEPEGGGCSKIVVAARSPKGTWTSVQTLPHSSGREARLTTPVLVNGHIEFGWWENTRGPYWIASARPGWNLGLRRVQNPPRTEEPMLLALHDQIYLQGETNNFVLRRAVKSNGRLGHAQAIRKAPHEAGGGFEGANGSESILVETAYKHRLWTFAVRHRTTDASSYGPPRALIRQASSFEPCPECAAQSFDHRTLITAEQKVAHKIRLAAVEISPQGQPGPVRVVQRNFPFAEDELFDAISDSGSVLVWTQSTHKREPVWLHSAAAHCPAFGPKTALRYQSVPEIVAGHGGTFHLAWDEDEKVHVAVARVTCSKRGP
jgi:hypothetical protein